MTRKTGLGRRIAVLATAALVVGGALLPTLASPAAALSGSSFDPGNIISDAVFFDSGALSVTQVQQFLDSQVKTCAAGASGPACLKAYRTTTVAKSAQTGICSGYTGNLVQSGAEIISGVATSCGVNPKVLIVLLQKEQSLVTATAPTAFQYRSATGYGCPDSSACDSQYYGFFNQVYMAARQFKLYAAYPASYAFRAGRTNQIAFSVNSACGSAPVYIANQATAGLYDYTPYQPNAAALNNLYGTGDSCSQYGNRNFWRIFSDWFGSTQAGGGYLLRSWSSAAVYLVTTQAKYPIKGMTSLDPLAALGAVGFVSDQYLAQHPTGGVVDRLLLAADHNVYLVDGTRKYPFASCDQVAAYGFSCPDSRLVDDTQLSAFTTGPMLADTLRTDSGRIYQVAGGQRHEAIDDDALVADSLPASSITVSDAALSYLPVGAPILRPGVIIRSRSTSSIFLTTGSGLVPVPASVYASTPLAGLPVRYLDSASLLAVPWQASLTVFAKSDTTSIAYLLHDGGLSAVTDAAALPAGVPTLPQSVIGLFRQWPDLGSPVLLKDPTSAAVFRIDRGTRRSIQNWDDAIRIAAATGRAPVVTVIDADRLASLPKGPDQLGPGNLVFSSSSPSVYLVDGFDRKILMGTWDRMANLGSGGLTLQPDSYLAAYATAPRQMTQGVTCLGTNYVASGGQLYPVADTAAPQYAPLPFTALSAETCGTLRFSSTQAGVFLRLTNGAIYYVDNGTKRNVSSYDRYRSLGGNDHDWIPVNADVLAWLPTGPDI